VIPWSEHGARSPHGLGLVRRPPSVRADVRLEGVCETRAGGLQRDSQADYSHRRGQRPLEITCEWPHLPEIRLWAADIRFVDGFDGMRRTAPYSIVWGIPGAQFTL